MIECWKNIDFTDGWYSVSNTGKVRSNSRSVPRTDGMPCNIKERILKPAIDKSGYSRVALSIDGKLVTKKVHRLVAEAFCLKHINEPEVNHIDGVKTNNHASNLEWVTRSQNVKHAFDTGLATSRMGENNPTCIIDDMKALTIITLLKSGFGPTKISRDLSISINICKDISRGKTWKHLS